MATILRSTGTTLSSTVKDVTTREMVDTDANVTVPGASGFATVQLRNSGLDTSYGAASFPAAPVLLGVDDILFLPLTFPEDPRL